MGGWLGIDERTGGGPGPRPVQRTPLDREVVVEAAIRLLDEVGLDGLTLRRLAQDLGVRAPALYWHFTGKRDLLEYMTSTIVARSVAATPPEYAERWDEWLGEHARARRRALVTHRDGARLAAGHRPLDSSSPFLEQTLGVLAGAGFPPGDALCGVIALSNYVDGFVLEEQAGRRRYAEAGYPLLASAFAEIGDPSGDQAFEHGLGLLLDGMRTALARRGTVTGPAGGPPRRRTPRAAS